jgi:hypothetical protein
VGDALKTPDDEPNASEPKDAAEEITIDESPPPRPERIALSFGLVGDALNVATELLRRFPDAELTSGKRDLKEQAAAMATNVLKERGWIGATYKPSPVSQALHAWALEKRHVRVKGDLAFGLLDMMRRFTPFELGKLSLHLTGEAFDVRPMNTARGMSLKKYLAEAAADKGGKFLEREGGLIRWHWQAKRFSPK